MITEQELDVIIGDTGLFDDPAFDQTSYNRGWVTIWYI